MRYYAMAIMLTGCLLSGCATHNLEVYNKLDSSNKALTVPPGGGGLTGALKSALKKEGWDLAVYRGPRVTEGSIGDKTRLEEYGTFNTRYTLFVDYDQYDWRFPDFDPMYHYDISLVDNRTGEEVMTISGRGARTTIVKKFMETLRNGG